MLSRRRRLGTQKFEVLAGDETVSSETVRDFGWHAGLGAELKLGRHAGLHADYRYTFLNFGDDDDEDEGFWDGPTGLQGVYVDGGADHLLVDCQHCQDCQH